MVFGLDFVGVVFALFFFAWSLSPSLLPRNWVFQGVVSGISSVAGYGVGLVLIFPARRWIEPMLSRWPLERRIEATVEILVVLAAVSTVVATVLAAANWQREIDLLMGTTPTAGTAYLRTGLISVVLFGIVLFCGRALRQAARGTARLLNSRLHLPLRAARIVAPITVAVAAAIFFDQVILTGSSGVAHHVFGAENNGTETGHCGSGEDDHRRARPYRRVGSPDPRGGGHHRNWVG